MALTLLAFSGTPLFGQTPLSPAVVTLGVPPPVAGHEFTMYALVTDPAQSAIPTGSIQFDFGDGTPVTTLPLTSRVAFTTHTYGGVGRARISASYSGDAAFAPATTTVGGEVLSTLAPVTLNVFGDSISSSWSGNNVSPDLATSWVPIVAYVHGWQLNNKAAPGSRVNDQCTSMYGTAISPSSKSAVLIGQNDFVYGDARIAAQYGGMLLACTAWLMIPETAADGSHPKVVAQSPAVTPDGAWMGSSLNPSLGLYTNQPGDSLTTSITGSAVYVGFSGTPESNFTADVYVDGQLAGGYTAANSYRGTIKSPLPFGIRIGLPESARSSSHTVAVVCRTPGATGCFVDWIGGNGFARPNQVPLLWLGEPYLSGEANRSYDGIFPYIQVLRRVASDFQSDGLGLTRADIFDQFNGRVDAQCLSRDGIHPVTCGNRILASIFLEAMNWLFTKDQRIDFGEQSPLSFGSGPVSIDVKATSGLPVSIGVTSGPAAMDGASLMVTGAGSVALEASQDGDGDFLPAEPVRQTITIAPAPVSVTLVPSASELNYNQPLSVTVSLASKFSGSLSGAVMLLDGSTRIGTATVNSAGTATFSSLVLSVGSHSLTASYTQQGNFAAAASDPVVVNVARLTPAVTMTLSSLSAVAMQALAVAVMVSGGASNPVPTGTVALHSGSFNSPGSILSDGSATINIAEGYLAAGNQNLTVSYTPDPQSSAMYDPAFGFATAAVAKAVPAISWPAPAPMTYGDVLGSKQLNASSAIGGTYTYSPAAGTIPEAGLHSVTVTFTPGDATNYTTATASVQLMVNPAVPAITWSTPAPITYGTPLSRAQLGASSAVAGTFAYSPPEGTVLSAGSHLLTATFTPADGANYTSASSAVTLTVSMAAPEIHWATPSPIVYGMPLAAAQLDAAGSVPGSFVYSPGPGTLLDVGPHTITGTFTPRDTLNYASGTATIVVTVQAAPLTVAADNQSITFGGAIPTLTGSLTGVIPGDDITASYTTTATAGCASGSYPIIATLKDPKSKLANYTVNATSGTLTIGKAAPVLTWAEPAAFTYGEALTSGQLNASASVPGSFIYSPPAGAVLAAGPQRLSVTFQPADATNYSSTIATVPLTVKPAAPVLTWAAPSDIVYGAALGPEQLNARASVPGTYSYAPPEGAIPAIGSNALTVTFTPADGSDYTIATATVPLVVVQPAPMVESLSPVIQKAGGGAFALTVKGAGFTPGSTIMWGTSALTTQYASPTQLTAQVPAGNIASAGTGTISVINPTPGGGASNPLQFQVDSADSGTPPWVSTASAIVIAGSSASFSVTLPSAASIAGVTCLNLPRGSACTYSGAKGAVVISTSPTTPAGMYQVTMVFTETLPGPAVPLASLLLLPLLLRRRSQARMRFWLVGFLWAAAAVAVLSAGCGGNIQLSPPPETHNVTNSAAVTLVVQ